MQKIATFISSFLLLATMMSSIQQVVDGSTCMGCATLDDITFDKTIAHFPYSIVKIDVAYPFGEAHENFAQFAQVAHKKTDDLLVATVGIKDYGDNENKAIGERFNLKANDYPGFFLFKGNSKDYVQLPSYIDVTIASLEKFVMDNTPIYLGKEGCLKQFNELSKNYANLSASEQLEVIAKAEKLAKKLNNAKQQAQALNYVLFMNKIKTNGYDFVEDETNRLLRLKAGKVTEQKKSELMQKLNILETFRVSKLSKQEL